jgi:hypothetical protein
VCHLKQQHLVTLGINFALQSCAYNMACTTKHESSKCEVIGVLTQRSALFVALVLTVLKDACQGAWGDLHAKPFLYVTTHLSMHRLPT